MIALRRAMLLFVSLAIFLAPFGVLGESGFSDDPDRVEIATKSVLMLEAYDGSGIFLGSGSGFVAFDNTKLVTNYHVIEGADTIVAYTDDGYQYIVDQVLIADAKRDLAILGFSSPTDLLPLSLNVSGELKRAQKVVAIGSPIGITNTVSIGNISALYEEDGVSEIQFTAPISPGSSGGALFDNNGEVIGITSATYLDAQNINVAVHAREVSDLFAQWDGTSYRTLSGEKFSNNSPATPEPADVRNIKVISDQFVWCESGRNVSNGSTETHVFEDVALEELLYETDKYSYYMDIIFSMDQGGELGTTVVFIFQLSAQNKLLDSITITKSFRQNEAQNVQRYFNISELMHGIPSQGTYTITCLIGSQELASRDLIIFADGRTPPPATPEPTPRPTPTPQPMTTPKTYKELKYGDKGDDVKKLQLALIRLGYLDDEADGIFGKNTRQAVYDFNLANGLITGDLEVASNKTQRLMYDGNPASFQDPAMALYIKDDAYAEWYNLSGDKIQIHFQVTNKAKHKTVKAFELYAYATNVWGNRIYGTTTVYYWTTTKNVKPGATVYSDYVTMPDRSEINTIYCGISRIIYTDGSIETLEDDEVDYSAWSIAD